MVTKNILVHTYERISELETLVLIERYCYTNTKIQSISKDADLYAVTFHSEVSFEKMCDAAKENNVRLYIQ